jgi:hypothetical protein
MTPTGFVNSVCHKWAAGPPTAAGTSSARTTAATIRSWLAARATTAGTTPTLHAPGTGRRVVPDADALAAGAKPDRGWRPDATWRLIQLLAMLGLIYKAKKPKMTV